MGWHTVETILSTIADLEVTPDYEETEKPFATVSAAALCLISTHYG